jgi:hypothetical protein
MMPRADAIAQAIAPEPGPSARTTMALGPRLAGFVASPWLSRRRRG